MTDKKTAHLGLPLPDAGNALAEDCPRLAEALISLDGHAQSADARLDGCRSVRPGTCMMLIPPLSILLVTRLFPG